MLEVLLVQFIYLRKIQNMCTVICNDIRMLHHHRPLRETRQVDPLGCPPDTGCHLRSSRGHGASAFERSEQTWQRCLTREGVY